MSIAAKDRHGVKQASLFLMFSSVSFPLLITQNLNSFHILSIPSVNLCDLQNHIQKMSLQVYCWGSNNCGQLGTGSTSNQSVPKKIAGLLGKL